MNTVFLLLGGNLGDRVAHLRKAVDLISQQIGKIEEVSALYETEPWGEPNQPSFLNQALRVNSYLEPMETLKAILSIEFNMGRRRLKSWEPRTIDIDILFYNREMLNTPELSIPHPQLQDRRFALVPLAEIAGDFIHPLLNRSIAQLLQDCPDPLGVKPYSYAIAR